MEKEKKWKEMMIVADTSDKMSAVGVSESGCRFAHKKSQSVFRLPSNDKQNDRQPANDKTS